MNNSTSDNLPAVGMRFCSGGRTITEADVTMFAALTGDWHPQHSDAVWAKTSPFGERIAHGMLILSLAFGLDGLDRSRVVALRRVRDAVFKRPVRFGDTIRAEFSVESARVVGSGVALVSLSLVVSNARSETVVRASIDVLWRTESTAWSGLATSSYFSLDMPPRGVIPL